MRICAHCGDSFPESKLVCPGCGADADLTWSPDITPDEIAADFGADGGYDDARFTDSEYEDFLRREGLATPNGSPKKRGGCGLFLLFVVPGIWALVLL